VIPAAVRWQQDRLELLDQRQLPEREIYLTIDSLEAAFEAIRSLAVRGAPAIGIAAGYALAASLRDAPAETARFLERLEQGADYLVGARPTAVNLRWALDRVRRRGRREPCYAAVRAEAQAIHAEDRAICRGIGAAGAALLPAGSRILTHCNAGALAVSELGTATAPIYHQHRAGVPLRVYADETRPLLQGARLTAWELDRAGVDVTLICDNAAASLMAAGEIDLVLVGTDRVTRNGDVVNKIGTLNLAVLCHHFGVPFYVACPSSTYDPATPSGSEVEIEERPAEEVLGDRAARVAVRNPAFDVTPAELVSAIVTERGIARPPLAPALAGLLGAAAAG